MRKIKALKKMNSEKQNFDDPFKIVHHYRIIYKSKRRSMLRKLKISREKNQECLEQALQQTNLERKQTIQIYDESSLWDVLFQPSRDFKQDSDNFPTLTNDISMDEEKDSIFNCEKPSQKQQNYFTEDERRPLFQNDFPRFQFQQA